MTEQSDSVEHQFGMAIKKGDLARMRAGLESGWPVNGWGEDGVWTPLRYTSEHQQVAAARLLLERGADVNHPERDGYSALEHSISAVVVFATDGVLVTWEHVDVLLEAGAEMTARSWEKIRSGGPEIEKSFEERGEPYVEWSTPLKRRD